MKKEIHPAAIAAAVVALLAMIGFAYVKFGSGDVKGAPIADTMKIEINHNKVNSITGEPLLPDQIEAQNRQNEMVRRMQGSGMADPRKTGTAPHFDPEVH